MRHILAAHKVTDREGLPRRSTLMPMNPELSVVIPMYNEQDVLPLLAGRLRPVLDGLDTAYEVVCVDDGSSDLTPALLQKLRRDWAQVRVLRLRANSGHQAAISAGLAHARGAYVVTIDADLQDPPEVIADMLATALREDVDVVYGVRNDRTTDSAFKRTSARVFYAFIRKISGTKAQSDAGDFRLMSRATVDAINALPEHGRVLRFIVPALGFPSASIGYRRDERAAGTSKYPLLKMIKLSLPRHRRGDPHRVRGARPCHRLTGRHDHPGVDVHGVDRCGSRCGAAVLPRAPR